MRILLTGAAGLLGAAAGRWLTERGDRVTGVDIVYGQGSAFPMHVRNLLDFTALDGLMDGVDAVVHLANHPNDFKRQPAQLLLTENVAMTTNLLTAAVQSGVRRIVYASSIQACRGPRTLRQPDKHSSLPYLPMDGDLPAQAWTPYGLSKVAGEQELAMLCRSHPDLRAVAVRFPGIWKDAPREAVPMDDLSFHSGWQRVQFSPLDECFTWIWLPDAVRLIGVAIDRAEPGLTTLLPTSAVPWVQLDLPAFLRQYFDGVPLRQPVESLTGLVDLRRIERDFGWTPTDPLSLQARSLQPTPA